MWTKYMLTMNTDPTKAALIETDLVPYPKEDYNLCILYRTPFLEQE